MHEWDGWLTATRPTGTFLVDQELLLPFPQGTIGSTLMIHRQSKNIPSSRCRFTAPDTRAEPPRLANARVPPMTPPSSNGMEPVMWVTSPSASPMSSTKYEHLSIPRSRSCRNQERTTTRPAVSVLRLLQHYPNVVCPSHSRTRKSLWDMIVKLSVMVSRQVFHSLGNRRRKKWKTASTKCPKLGCNLLWVTSRCRTPHSRSIALRWGA